MILKESYNVCIRLKENDELLSKNKMDAKWVKLIKIANDIKWAE